MEVIEKRKQINHYLDKNYFIKERRFYKKSDEEVIFGHEIANELPTIFSFETDFCLYILTKWAYRNYLDKKEV